MERCSAPLDIYESLVLKMVSCCEIRRRIIIPQLPQRAYTAIGRDRLPVRKLIVQGENSFASDGGAEHVFGRRDLEAGEAEVQCQDPTRARTGRRVNFKFTWAILLTIPLTSSLLLLPLFSLL